jgi:hypothetical protein
VFPTRLSEVTPQEVQNVITLQAAESWDFELKRDLPAKKGKTDPWMTGGKIGDDAKDELAAEIIAFANAGGGTLIVGIGEDRATKRAIPPIVPLPRCKEAAERLHQAITDRIEPKLPMFECEGVITEADGNSGVVIMRTLESYLAPHRHTQNRHCYVRRNDRAEPMSMREIHDLTLRNARFTEEIDRAFARSSEEFFEWIPGEFRRHPARGVQVSGSGKELGLWALRLSARPVPELHIAELPRQPWLKQLVPERFSGGGRQGDLKSFDIDNVMQLPWTPRLRAVGRTLSGEYTTAFERIGATGEIDRFVRFRYFGERKKFLPLPLSEIMWHFVSVIRYADVIRSVNFRPGQLFGLEVEFMPSESFKISGYPGPVPSGVQLIPAERVTFPRYEIGPREGFDRLLTTFDRDLWNLAQHDPQWSLGVDWPTPATTKASSS